MESKVHLWSKLLEIDSALRWSEDIRSKTNDESTAIRLVENIDYAVFKLSGSFVILE